MSSIYLYTLKELNEKWTGLEVDGWANSKAYPFTINKEKSYRRKDGTSYTYLENDEGEVIVVSSFLYKDEFNGKKFDEYVINVDLTMPEYPYHKRISQKVWYHSHDDIYTFTRKEAEQERERYYAEEGRESAVDEKPKTTRPRKPKSNKQESCVSCLKESKHNINEDNTSDWDYEDNWIPKDYKTKKQVIKEFIDEDLKRFRKAKYRVITQASESNDSVTKFVLQKGNECKTIAVHDYLNRSTGKHELHCIYWYVDTDPWEPYESEFLAEVWVESDDQPNKFNLQFSDENYHNYIKEYKVGKKLATLDQAVKDLRAKNRMK